MASKKIMEKLMETAEKAAEAMGNKTDKAVEAVLDFQLKTDLLKEQDELFKNLGKLVFEKYKDSKDNCLVKRAFLSEFVEIESNLKALEELEENKLERKGLKTCINCSENIPLDVDFCPKCGAEQPDIDEEYDDEEEVFVCAHCNTEVPEDAKFCPKCGKNLE